ncbi:MAG: hypothetical protein Q7R69_00235 [bacterium]|nr:hypothetical protein [bacterium]
MKKLFLAVALVATLIPAIFVIYEVGGWRNWQGVLPRGSTDSLYYYARMHEVVDGYPLLGNPYVYEYRKDLAPAFFLPDIVSAIPMLLGVPFNLAVMINMFAWSFVFLALSFTLLRLLRLPRGWAFLWSVFLYISLYSLMLRPTIMQIVYPFFLMFLIALLKFLYEPHERKRIVWLSLAAASAFYVYSYLSYIVLLSFAFIFFWFLFTRRFQELRSLLTCGIFTALLLIPFGFYTLMQMQGPYYFETLSRIGLVYTRVPSIEVFFYGRWLAVGMLLTWLVPLKQKVFWFSTGAALFVSLCLNIITGVELTLGVHVGRFVILWMVIILGVGLYEWYFSETLKTHRTKYIVVAILLSILSVGVVRNLPHGLDFFKFFGERGSDYTADLQTYAGPLKWLDKNVPEQSVIWANDSISEYIPIMTRHYPLFTEGTVLHNISGPELEDRYLVSHSMDVLTIEDIKSGLGLYAGAGPSELEPLAQNRRAWLCDVWVRFAGPRQCPPRTDSITLRGEEYFKTLVERFKTVKKDQATLLQQFNVKYLILDRAHDNLERISLNKALYDDGRFVILSLPL